METVMHRLGIFLTLYLFTLQVHAMGTYQSCAEGFGTLKQTIVFEQSADGSGDDGKDDKKEGGSEAEPDCE